MDVLLATGALLDSVNIIENLLGQAMEVASLHTPIANPMFLFAPDFSPRAPNHRDPAVRARNFRQSRAVVEFCRGVPIPSVTVVPGIDQEGWRHEKSLVATAEALNEFAAIAAAAGVTHARG